MGRFRRGATAYVVVSRLYIRRVTVVNYDGDFYTVRFDGKGGMRVRESRLYATEAEAGKITRNQQLI